MRSNAPFMISVQTSGSTFSAAAVEPLTSQKSMVMTRRSPALMPPWVRAASSLATSSGGRYCPRKLEPPGTPGLSACFSSWRLSAVRFSRGERRPAVHAELGAPWVGGLAVRAVHEKDKNLNTKGTKHTKDTDAVPDISLVTSVPVPRPWDFRIGQIGSYSTPLAGFAMRRCKRVSVRTRIIRMRFECLGLTSVARATDVSYPAVRCVGLRPYLGLTSMTRVIEVAMAA